MHAIEIWPLASRADIVGAFRRDADPKAEGPYRTLRRHEQVSAGQAVFPHDDGGFEGRFTFFCSLNVDAARLARRGLGEVAQEVAVLAARIEAGHDFVELVKAVSAMSGHSASAIQSGSWPLSHRTTLRHTSTPSDATRQNHIMDLLVRIATQTANARRSVPELQEIDVMAGTVTHSTEKEVVVSLVESGATYRVPRWLADQAGRAARGSTIVIITERVNSYLLAGAVPGIATDFPTVGPFDPFAPTPGGMYLGDDESLLDTPHRAQVLVPMRSRQE